MDAHLLRSYQPSGTTSEAVELKAREQLELIERLEALEEQLEQGARRGA